MNNKKAAATTLISIFIEWIPMLLIMAIQLAAPLIARKHQEVEMQKEALAIIESAQETTFLSTFVPNLLLALSAAFTLNFILILFYSREKKNRDLEAMSGTCSHFEIKKPEIS